jgi:sterol 3beta-glucosyltransferase
LARSRRLSIPPSRRDGATPYSPVDEEENESDILSSGDEAEAEDFEETPRPPDSEPTHVNLRALSESVAERDVRYDGSMAAGLSRIVPSRTGSMATVRLQRRAGLAAKLKEVFDLDGIEEVWAGKLYSMNGRRFLLTFRLEMPCWLLRSVCESFIVMALTHVLISQCAKCSITRLHVSDEFIPVFLCAYAIKRGRHRLLPQIE